jgi:hypothetical protein
MRHGHEFVAIRIGLFAPAMVARDDRNPVKADCDGC